MNESAIWLEHRERLLRFILSRGIQSDDAEDIVQDVLTKALVPGGGPTDPDRLVPWLYHVVRNAITDHWRRRRPTEEVPDDLADAGPDGMRPDHLLQCLEPFLSRLDPEDAAVLRLADAEDRPQAQIAAELGLSVSGAKSRIQRARAKVLDMYRRCCAVELDRGGRLVDHAKGPCPDAATNCGDSGCR